MRGQLHEYFAGEKNEGYAFLGVGTASTALGLGLALSDSDRSRGASVPLLAVGLVQLGAGAYLMSATGRQDRERATLLTYAPGEYAAQESARMEQVNRRFRLYKKIEVGMLGAGAVMGVAGGASKTDALAGAGLSLFVQSLIMLAFDSLAEQRGLLYQRRIADFSAGR